MRSELLDKIYTASNDGLDIIIKYFPQADGCDKPGKKFKMRTDERTASASLKKIKGVWRATDFGDEGTALTPIQICMREEHLEFREALFLLADRYKVDSRINSSVNKPVKEFRDATADEPEGEKKYELNEKLTKEELALLGPFVTQEVCDRYNYYSVKWYSTVKNRKVMTVHSTENYPIFLHDCGSFKKVYKPLEPEKQYRFFCIGEKPERYINGLDVLKKLHEDYVRNMDSDSEVEEARGDGEEKPRRKSDKLPEAILCSGERDALNCAGMGYPALWLNSETAKLEPGEYAEIMKRVDTLYNVPDNDDTGVAKGRELAKKYIDIRTVELPAWLGRFKDNRGRPRKDLRDFVDLRPDIRQFKELVKVAKACKFWERVSDGKRLRYEINTLFLLHFLKVHGFGKMVDPDNDVVTYVRIQGFKVKQVSTRNIQDFITTWARERNLDIEIQNLILNSSRINSGMYEKIETVAPDFRNYDEKSQTLFFNNKVVKVTADEVEETGGGAHAWERAVCGHDFKRIEPSFTAVWDKESGRYSMKLNHMRSHFFRFLVNASRIYWREELEDRAPKDPTAAKAYRQEHHWDIAGPLLTEDEQMEQQRHLANKLFAIGYLMHSYKNLAKAWGLWIMENKITEEDESGGGSGKTFMIRFLKNFKNTEMVNGRDKKLTENNFFLDRVTERTDILLIDDAVKYFNFNFFYSMITDNMVVNYKNARSKEIPFTESPKLVVTSNFPPPAGDGSTARRLLTCVFSDYYHQATSDNDYESTVRIADDFGYELYNESYKEEWWLEDINFMIDCLQFYLQSIPFNLVVLPPMENVDRRMRNQTMGDEFKEWAEVYFSQAADNHLNRLMLRSEVHEAFDPKKKFSSKGFMKRLRAFCANADHIEELNPKECRGYDPRNNRIVRKVNGKVQEYIYLRTVGAPIDDEVDPYRNDAE